MADFTNPNLKRAGGVGLGGFIIALVALVILAVGLAFVGGPGEAERIEPTTPAPVTTPAPSN